MVANDFKFFCNGCGTHISNRSKHCGKCNRCVDTFDHHCDFVNNCIGKKNYLHFIILISLIASISILQCSCNIVVITSFHTSNHKVNLAVFYNSPELIMQILAYVMIGVCIIINSYIAQEVCYLLILHEWLIENDLTTFDYIKYLDEIKQNPNNEIVIENIKKEHKSRLKREVKKENNLTEIKVESQVSEASNISNGPKEELSLCKKLYYRRLKLIGKYALFLVATKL